MGAGSLEPGGRLAYTDNKDEFAGIYGSDVTRTRDLRRDRPAFRLFCSPATAGVVVLENELQTVGEGVGGAGA
jgi:hypothetical protein